MLHRLFFALSIATSVQSYIPASVRPMPNILLSLCKNTKWISMKFEGGNNYHKQINWLHFGQNWNREQDTRENLNLCKSVLPYIKRVLLPSEQIDKFHYTDAITDTISR